MRLSLYAYNLAATKVEATERYIGTDCRLVTSQVLITFRGHDRQELADATFDPDTAESLGEQLLDAAREARERNAKVPA